MPLTLKDLSRRQALLCLEIEKNCALLPGGLQGRRFLLAVSGGADSTALAIIFHILARKNNFHIEMANIDHKLRREALIEQEFTRQLAARMNINFHGQNLETAQLARERGIGLEEAGRIGRQNILCRLREEIQADYILTGHHAGDLAEDILMRLARGSGWPALGGMQALNDCWFRPLLHILPERLRLFLQEIGQPWHEDASNQDRQFTRNRFRHEIIPLFLHENCEFLHRMIELNRLAEADAEFWDAKMCQSLDANPWQEGRRANKIEIFLPNELIINTSAAEHMRLYMRALRRLKQLSGQPIHARARTIFKLERHIGRTGIFQFPGNATAQTGKKGLLFSAPIKDIYLMEQEYGDK